MAKKDNDKTPKKYNLRKKKKKEKYYQTSDDSDEDDSDWVPGEEEDSEIERALDFQKFLQKLFPSKNQSEKVRQLKNIKKMLESDEDDVEEKPKKIKRLVKKR